MAVILIAAVGAVVGPLLRPQEPRYQGRPLHVWLADFDLSGRGNPEKATEAVRAIGTNALPLLSRMIGAKDRAWQKAVMALNAKQSLIQINLTEAGIIRFRAVEGYRALGSEAKESVPTLIQLMNSERNAEVRADVATALGWIGADAKAAIPAISKATQDPNATLRSSAIAALANIHSTQIGR